MASGVHEIIGEVPTTIPCNIVMRHIITRKFVVVTVYPKSWEGLDAETDSRFAVTTIDCAIKTAKVLMLHRNGTISMTCSFVPETYVNEGNWLTFVLLDVALHPDAVATLGIRDV